MLCYYITVLDGEEVIERMIYLYEDWDILQFYVRRRRKQGYKVIIRLVKEKEKAK